MEKIARVLSTAVLILFALLFGFALLLGACRPAHLSYPAAFSAAVVIAAVYAMWQKKPRKRPSVWQRMGERKTEALLLSLCFVLNLAWALFFRLEPEVDYATFWKTAVDLAAGEQPSLRAYVAMFPHILGYSTFLSLVLRVFGTGPLVAPITNVFLTTLSGFFLFRLTMHYRKRLHSAAFVLLAWSLFPSKLLYNTMVLSEPWYTCLILAVFWLCSEVELRSPKLGVTLLLGLAAGLLLRLVNAARPIAAVPIIALLIWVFLLRKGRDAAGRKTWWSFTAVLLAAYLLTGPLWTNYERRVLGEEPASIPGYSLYVGANTDSLGSYSEEDMDLLQHYRFDLEDGSAENAQQRMLRLSWERAKRLNFARLGPLLVFKLRTFLGNDEGGAYYSLGALSRQNYRLLAIYSNIWYYVLGILALWGTWRLFRFREQRTILLAPLYVIGLTMAHMLVEVAARYHYSVIPMLLLLAAFSFYKPTRTAEMSESEAKGS